ncbi:hypothetical protein SCHPADRAFT_905428 [Schizopora paradoxa]|uniref:Uncharacterized protein n=1 Tax=Schizopora paradoxa TaxID=27342 RepID=A0A0H2RKI9_9AGAM|nr:hypothetical protein SCHPADRAFT_905428 [Schizopora paradoxa]
MTTRDPKDAIACPERAHGAGPMFWNMYQRCFSKQNAASSARSYPSTPRPPKTYILPSATAAACPSRAEGL